MNRVRLTLIAVLLLLSTAMPLAVLANSQSYTPPAEKGYIYIVVRYKTRALPENTRVSISWGKWNKTSTVSAARLLLPGRGIPEGFVIRLRHSKNDSIPLRVDTDGRVLSISQGEAPSEWSDSANYKQVNW